MNCEELRVDVASFEADVRQHWDQLRLGLRIRCRFRVRVKCKARIRVKGKARVRIAHHRVAREERPWPVPSMMASGLGLEIPGLGLVSGLLLGLRLE